MPQHQQDYDDGWGQDEWLRHLYPEREESQEQQEQHGNGDHQAHQATREMEPGWRATQALIQLESDALLKLMLRPSFRPINDLDLVPVAPCTHCGDGGLRSAGSVRARHGRELVRACDTCGTILVGEQVWPPVRS